MKGHWTALVIGLALGAGVGLMRSQTHMGGGSHAGRPGSNTVTGAPNAPFQAFINNFKGRG